jgi:hypothetical protein
MRRFAWRVTCMHCVVYLCYSWDGDLKRSLGLPILGPPTPCLKQRGRQPLYRDKHDLILTNNSYVIGLTLHTTHTSLCHWHFLIFRWLVDICAWLVRTCLRRAPRTERKCAWARLWLLTWMAPWIRATS